MPYLIALAWMYVVVMAAAAELTSPQGTWLGAVFTVLGWGALPLGIVLYIIGTPARRRARRAREVGVSAPDPDRRRHAPGDVVAPEREEA